MNTRQLMVRLAAAAGSAGAFGFLSMVLLRWWSSRAPLAEPMTAMELTVAVVVNLVSGTWAWAVLGALGTAMLTRGDHGPAGRRWLRAWAVSSVLVMAVSAAWYGTASASTFMGSPADIALLAAVSAVVGAGLAVVGAFWHDRGARGLLARLALPAGLLVVLLLAPPADLSWGGSARLERTIWFTQHGLGAALALAIGVVAALGRRRLRSSSVPAVLDAPTALRRP